MSALFRAVGNLPILTESLYIFVRRGLQVSLFSIRSFAGIVFCVVGFFVFSLTISSCISLIFFVEKENTPGCTFSLILSILG